MDSFIGTLFLSTGSPKVFTIAHANSRMVNIVTIIIITNADLQHCVLQQEVVLRLLLPFCLATQFI